METLIPLLLLTPLIILFSPVLVLSVLVTKWWNRDHRPVLSMDHYGTLKFFRGYNISNSMNPAGGIGLIISIGSFGIFAGLFIPSSMTFPAVLILISLMLLAIVAYAWSNIHDQHRSRKTLSKIQAIFDEKPIKELTKPNHR